MDLIELKKGAGFLLAGQVAQAVIGFGANLVLVRFLLPEEFGHFALVMAGAALVFVVVSLRLDAIIIRAPDGGFGDQEKDRYFSAAIYETVIASVLLVSWLFWKGDPGGWEFGLVVALGFRHWAQQNKGFYERSLPYRKLALVESFVATSSHVFTVCLILLGAGAEVLFLREFYLTVCGLIGIWWIGGVTIRRFRLLSINDIRSLLFEAKGIWLDGVLENSFSRIVILFVGEIGGERTAGFFFQAQKLALVPQQLIAPAVGRVAANWFARTDDQGVRQAGRNKVLGIITAFLIAPVLLCILAADPIVPLLFGDNWARSADLLVAMSGMIMFITLFEILRNYCWATKLVRWVLIARCAQYVGGALPLVLWYMGVMTGDVALALGLSTAYAFAFVTLFSILLKTEK